ncbi:DHA2 family efflux MFS transporter permease subunit [Anaeromyxobacter oryzisoli]|uniref:DHA2 family efflux MFS transporter permease subunit n=1 Tax=Anaeromyxobacter oryzisoli TaxID=2925408 RepID=UPI001F56C1C7|nr:DHA2 family efflux MFS transporter permease subunit [Anaeromyxobacter sp. SG63]
MSAADAPEQGFTGGHDPWAVAMTVTLATFMEVLDTSIANVALPHMAGSLSVSQDESTWVLTSYLVSNAIVLPVSGWFASRFGRKRFYMTCVAIFTASSFLCGIAPSLGALIFFRVLQGLGGGGLGPSEQAILADTFPPQKRGMAFAVYAMAVVVAPAIGPTLGGYITDRFNWRWVFFINVPVGIVSLLLSRRMIVDPPWVTAARRRVGRIDYPGLALVALGLGALEVVLDRGQEDEWFASATITAFAVVAAVTLVTFAAWEWRQEHPVVDVRLFTNRSFAAANFMMVVLGIALFGSTVLLPQYLQVWMGYTAQQAGMVLSPGGVVVILLLPVVGRLVSRHDARWLIAFGFIVISLSMFHMVKTLYPGIDFRTAVELRMWQAAGLAFLFVPINTVVYAGVPPEKNNAVSGIVNLSRNLGGSIGIALVTTLIARRAQFHQANLAAHLDAGSGALLARLAGVARALERAGTSSVDATRQAYAVVYRQLLQQAQTLAYLDALFVLACFTAAMVPLVFLTRRVEGGRFSAH